MKAHHKCGLLVLVLMTGVAGSAPPPGVATLHRPPAPGPAARTVAVYGAAGSFGGLGDMTPSGQSLGRYAVEGWSLPGGLQLSKTVLAGDGTVLMAAAGHDFDQSTPTSNAMVVAAFEPGSNAYATVRIADGPGAPSVADLEPVPGGVAFAARAATGGSWPVFGVLSSRDGRWRVADRWAGAALPAEGLVEMATMARSGDIVAVQPDGDLSVLRLSGPDAAGHFSVRVRGSFDLPDVAGRALALKHLAADPTSPLGDERFAVTLGVRDTSAKPAEQQRPGMLLVFSYDADTGAIRTISGPLIPGDRATSGRPYSFGAVLYDRRGYLWVARHDIFNGGSLAMYTADPCAERAESGAGADRQRVWGRACRPDYDLLQGNSLLAIQAMAEDPATGDVVALVTGGAVLAIRPSGTGTHPSFRVGNVVDLARKLLPSADGDFPDQRMGAVDAQHRLWISAATARPGQRDVRLDQWLYAVDLRDLFAPGAVDLPAAPGRSVTIQAERTSTTGTTRRPGRWAGTDIDSHAFVLHCFDWPANVGCGYDDTSGNGFVLGDDSHFGRLDGSVEYRVATRTAASFRVAYRVSTFEVTKTARIELTAAGRSVTTAVDTGGPYRQVWMSGTITLPAGEQTIRLSVPANGGGWFLNSLTLQRD